MASSLHRGTLQPSGRGHDLALQAWPEAAEAEQHRMGHLAASDTGSRADKRRVLEACHHHRTSAAAAAAAVVVVDTGTAAAAAAF